jgi:DNA-binding transcriptional LysR family regulator
VIGSLPDIPQGCASEYLAAIPSATVAAPEHPLAKIKGTVSRVAMSKHVQLVLTDRSQLTAGREFGVMSPLVWRLADLGAKHAFLRAGLGWGSMPLHMVEQDLADGSLVQLRLKAHPLLGTAFSMHAAWLKDQPPGPAGRWFVDQLKCDFG